jgi:hypothetical protein
MAGQGKKRENLINQKRSRRKNQDSTGTSGKSIKVKKKPNGRRRNRAEKTLQDRPQNRKGIDTNAEQRRDICHAIKNNESNRICFPGLRQRDAKLSSASPRISHAEWTRDSAAG